MIAKEKTEHLKINEIFVSVQGEGVNAGIPAIFIRLAGCQLQCQWCDSKYAKNGKEYSTEELTNIIKEISNENPFIERIIITGGEPLLQSKELSFFIEKLKAKYEENAEYMPHIEIETNGGFLPINNVSQYNISLKLPSSGNKKYIKDKIIENFLFYPGSLSFKFVVDKMEDIIEIEYLIKRHKIPYWNIVIMPQGTTAEELDSKALWIIPECIKRGWRFSDRLHIRIWKGKKGV